MNKYDVIVIGGGHAGIEAALAAARMGCVTLLVTLKKETIGLMSCNPAIGGVGKGQLVKEIDALGGEMGKAIDACGIQFRILNASKGAAVQSSRAQADRRLYQKYMEEKVIGQKNLVVKEEEVTGLVIEEQKITGIECTKETFSAQTVVIATGTFLGGVIHIGLEKYQAGRINEPASIRLSTGLKKAGLKIGRLKTCTTPRLDGKTLDFSRMTPQPGDVQIKPFSFSTQEITLAQKPCFLTYTNKETHQIIRSALKDKKLLSIISQGTNPRYCPSIEDKVMRFPEKARHQIFIEPEGLDTDEYYANGLFTFLSGQAQQDLVHTIPGLERVEIKKLGYGIEYDYVYPTQLYPTLETKRIRNLYLAGQINGTTGYEEAAAQGLIGGINAALRVKEKEPLILDRASSYIGVLIDDLATKGTNEPYRMFTSRVEYRLILREDNADLRLHKIGYDLGLISKERYRETEKKREAIKNGIHLLKNTHLRPTLELNRSLEQMRSQPLKRPITLEEILKRPEINLVDLLRLDHLKLEIPEIACQQVEIEVKYAGFIERQLAEVQRFKNLEKIKLPTDLNYMQIPSLSREIQEKLEKAKPVSLGQASRISGVTPAAISLLMVYLRKVNRNQRRE